MRFTVLLLALAILVMLIPTTSDAAASHYTKTYTSIAASSGYSTVCKWEATFLATTDTFYLTIDPGMMALDNYSVDTMVSIFNFYIGSLNGDSVDLSVRFETSDDNTNWKSTTIGTDSTTWVSTTTAPLCTVVQQKLGTTSFPVAARYNRLVIMGNAGNVAGTYFKVYQHKSLKY